MDIEQNISMNIEQKCDCDPLTRFCYKCCKG